jgi:ankyrin repeat protein
LTATSFLVNSVKRDTLAIRNDVADIKQDTSQITTLVHEIGLLRLHVSQLEGRGGSGGVLLERFLAESTTYAESVVDIEDLKAVAPEQNPTLTVQEEGDGSGWDSPWTNDDLDEQYHAPVSQPTQSPENTSRSSMQEPVSVSPVQWPSPDRGAHFRLSSNVLPATRPIARPKVDSLWGSLRKKTKEGERQSELLHREAIKVAATKAREKLSQSKREQLDNKLLFLLGDIQNSRWASLRGKEHRSARSSAKIGTQEEVRAVLDRGADPNARARGDGSAENAGCTGLIIEIKNAGRIGVVRLLLSRGADVNATGGLYSNALQTATAHPREEQYKNELLKTLLACGADVNAQGGYYGNALQGAAFRGDLGAVELLLEHGADVNAPGGVYESALRAASVKGNVDIIRFLLEHGADTNAQGGEFGNTLQAAAYWSNLETVELLMEHGADVNAQGGSYGSALQAASVKGHVEVVHFLLEHGADINGRGGCYGSALQAASAYCHSSIVRLLLQHGADVNARGGRHGSALQAAFSNSSAPLGKREMTVKLLREHQATE